MPRELTWDDADDIGILLSEKHPETDPLSLRITDLHRYVTELSDFKDDPKKSLEGKLEAIQMPWHADLMDPTQGESQSDQNQGRCRSPQNANPAFAYQTATSHGAFTRATRRKLAATSG